MNTEEKSKKEINKEWLTSAKGDMEALRAIRDGYVPLDISLQEYIRDTKGSDLDSYMEAIGISMTRETISNLLTTPQFEKAKWIIPEIYRSAILLGYREGPIYPQLIAGEEQMQGLNAIIPFIEMSDAVPRRVNEAETIPLGNLKYGSKQFSIFKVGRGISLSDEVRRYSSLNLVSIFLRDFGIQLGQGTDYLAMQCLLNGEQPNGSESAPHIGIRTPGSKEYRDMLRIFIRGNRMGRRYNLIIGSEEQALNTLDMDEFSIRRQGTPDVRLNLSTPVPNSVNYLISDSLVNEQELMVDSTAAMIKFNGVPLTVEHERIVSNQTEAFYCSLTLGFAKMFVDAALVLDSTLNFNTHGFPDFMDIRKHSNVIIQ